MSDTVEYKNMTRSHFMPLFDVTVPLWAIRNINSNKNDFGILPRAGLDPLLFAF